MLFPIWGKHVRIVHMFPHLGKHVRIVHMFPKPWGRVSPGAPSQAPLRVSPKLPCQSLPSSRVSLSQAPLSALPSLGDLKFAVAKPPKKDVKRARAVLKRFLLVVSKAEKRGITRYGSKKTLSAYDAKKIRSKVRMSFAHYARK